MSRITEKQLDAQVTYLNKLTNSPESPYVRVDGIPVAQIGNYHIYCGGGSYALHRMANKSGGIIEITRGETKAALHGKIEAYIRGIRDAGEKV